MEENKQEQTEVKDIKHSISIGKMENDSSAHEKKHLSYHVSSLE